jgi:hypothetical protein
MNRIRLTAARSIPYFSCDLLLLGREQGRVIDETLFDFAPGIVARLGLVIALALSP